MIDNRGLIIKGLYASLSHAIRGIDLQAGEFASLQAEVFELRATVGTLIYALDHAVPPATTFADPSGPLRLEVCGGDGGAGWAVIGPAGVFTADGGAKP